MLCVTSVPLACSRGASSEGSESGEPVAFEVRVRPFEQAIRFSRSDLLGSEADNPTVLQFGPDGRLYVGHLDGLIRVYTIVRRGPARYEAVAVENLTEVREIPNHNDSGEPEPRITTRQLTGLVVTGTPRQPVVYVSSSDPRIGGGSDNKGKFAVDTNSGVLSRLLRTPQGWQRLDLVRGLPRSEESHSTNGLAYDPERHVLYVAQGSNTNTGAPSTSFLGLPEYALSAAILRVDLRAIGEQTYDLPTLDDEDRAGIQDANDPFGGNAGKNQARIVPGGPVEVYAPGFRNPYDLVIAGGRLYTVDNGPNQKWGGLPEGEGPGGTCTHRLRDGGATHGDQLHLVRRGVYGGHPNPTRGNPAIRFNASNPQSPVPAADPRQCQFLAPGEDGALAVFPASTNGLVEYTASNFGGVLQGDILAGSWDNRLIRIRLAESGEEVLEQETLFADVGASPLDVTALGDGEIFPGTIWVADLYAHVIRVFEPADYRRHEPHLPAQPPLRVAELPGWWGLPYAAADAQVYRFPMGDRERPAAVTPPYREAGLSLRAR